MIRLSFYLTPLLFCLVLENKVKKIKILAFHCCSSCVDIQLVMLTYLCSFFEQQHFHVLQ